MPSGTWQPPTCSEWKFTATPHDANGATLWLTSEPTWLTKKSPPAGVDGNHWASNGTPMRAAASIRALVGLPALVAVFGSRLCPTSHGCGPPPEGVLTTAFASVVTGPSNSVPRAALDPEVDGDRRGDRDGCRHEQREDREREAGETMVHEATPFHEGVSGCAVGAGLLAPGPSAPRLPGPPSAVQWLERVRALAGGVPR